MEEFKQLLPIIGGGVSGGAVMLLALWLGRRGEWMWNHEHNAQMKIQLDASIEVLRRSDLRADEWKAMALQDRPLAEKAIQVTGAVVRQLDGGE